MKEGHPIEQSNLMYNQFTKYRRKIRLNQRTGVEVPEEWLAKVIQADNFLKEYRKGWVSEFDKPANIQDKGEQL